MTKTIGKRIHRRTYVHVSCLELLDPKLRTHALAAIEKSGLQLGKQFNVIRFEQDRTRLALLFYSDFFDTPYPELKQSWVVDIEKGNVSHRTYEGSLNPPILHRKELLLPEDHPRALEYNELTRTAEAIGLFDDTKRIGFKEQWRQLIHKKGYMLIGNQLLPRGNDETDADVSTDSTLCLTFSGNIARHLTALVRHGFSAPVQSLARHGLLGPEKVFFDYGCGRGDDVRGLTENGLQASGWDPHYAIENSITPAHLVNLGFVINVIENLEERITALRNAYQLSSEVLVVAAMLANQNEIEGHRLNDGIVTKRGTFQKYYSQTELKIFIEQTLSNEAIAVGPGIFYVFRDKDAEQRFLSERYRRRRTILRGASYHPHGRPPRIRQDRKEEKYQAYSQELENLWECWVSLGREPEPTEVSDLVRLTEGFGSLRKALKFLAKSKNLAVIEISRKHRIEDFEVYFALNQFEKRKPYRHLEASLQRDIKAFFGDYKGAQQAARDLLFEIAKPSAISDACEVAAKQGLGWLEPNESLQLHTRLVEQLPPLLRVYVGCAAVLYGDYRDADLIKIHIRSGKLTLLRFDDFSGSPLPRMIERVKIKLREQDIEYYAYGEEYEPPFLYHKSRYINEEFELYPEQLGFDKALETLPFICLVGYGPKPEELLGLLKINRWEISGYSLCRSQEIPNLDEPCGRYHKFYDLIKCGETQQNTKVQNVPVQPDTFIALHDLAVNILDPVIDYFGGIELTYGFCSSALAKHIKRGIAPSLDQHAAHEKRRDGTYICTRLGAAIDFLVRDEDMREVAMWISQNLQFDRLYFYGHDRPVHVSHGPELRKEKIEMRITGNGRSIPRVVSSF